MNLRPAVLASSQTHESPPDFGSGGLVEGAVGGRLQPRAAAAYRAPDGNDPHAIGSDDAVVHMVASPRHQDPTMLTPTHRLVGDAQLWSGSDLVERRSQLLVKERRCCQPIRPPPAGAPLSLPHRAR